MSAVNAPPVPPAVPDLATLADYLDANLATHLTAREQANGQLFWVLRYLDAELGEPTIGPLIALLQELHALDDGEPGPITTPSVKGKPTKLSAWTRAIVLAIVDSGMGSDERMAPILKRILDGSGLVVEPRDISNWRGQQRDPIQYARRHDGLATEESAFDYNEYLAAKALLSPDSAGDVDGGNAEASLIAKLKLIGQPVQRRQRT